MLPLFAAITAMSADGKLGVSIPDDDGEPNAVVAIPSLDVVDVLPSLAIFEHESHARVLAWWVDHVLVWYVDGKWGSFALVVADLDAHRQTDVRADCVREVLARLRAARPKLYAEVATQNGDWGSWYEDGFAIDVRPGGDKFPLALAIDVTSNPKHLADEPMLEASMTATLARDGTLRFGKLAIK